jgi:WhiB family redox-sensing transcriptional regulator
MMAQHDLDRQSASASPLDAAALAPHRRPRPGILALHADPSAWMLRGACRGEDPELFFPISTTGPGLAQANSAKALCGRCQVLANCLSLITRPDGIWGGTTSEERWSASHAR